MHLVCGGWLREMWEIIALEPFFFASGTFAPASVNSHIWPKAGQIWGTLLRDRERSLQPLGPIEDYIVLLVGGIDERDCNANALQGILRGYDLRLPPTEHTT